MSNYFTLKNLKMLALLLPFLLFLISKLFFPTKETYDEIALAHNYCGIIKEKFISKVPKLKILTTQNTVIEVPYSSIDLNSLASVGDSLCKFKNSNWCTLKKSNGKEYNIEYIYIPVRYR